MFHLRRNPSGAQIPDKTAMIGNVQRIILGRATRSYPARQKTRRTGVEPFVTNSASVQSGRSTRRGNLPILGLSYQLMCTLWPAFIPQGHKELTRILSSRLLPFVSENHHERVSSPFAALHHEPKHLASQAATLAGFTQEHTIQSVDTTSQKPSSGDSKFRSPWPQTRALVQHGISQNQSFWVARVWHAPHAQARNHRMNAELCHGKWGKHTLRHGSFLRHLENFHRSPPSSEKCGEWIEGCLRAALQILSARVRHSWRPSNHPSATFLATSPIGSSSLPFFKQMLCDELLGPTFL